METNKKLGYIAQKIVETKIAILSCFTNGLLKIPNTVIKTIHVDPEGQIWFFVGRPLQLLSQFDPEFPVELNYFKKGQGYYMNILGKGRLITEIEEISNFTFLSENEKFEATASNVLMRVKIQRVDYHLSASPVGNSAWEKIKSLFGGLFKYSGNRIFDFTSTYH